MRVTGLATGLDTDALVKQMLTPYQTKVDKAKQDRDIMALKQQLYRDVTKDLNDLYKKYFDVTSPTSLVMSSTYKTSMFTSSSNGISAVGLAGAKVGNYKVDIKEKADSARVNFDIKDLPKNAEGKYENLQIDINGKKADVDLSNANTNEDIVSTINSSLKKAGIEGKASISTISGKISLETKGVGADQLISINSKGSILSESSAELDIDFSTISGKTIEIDVNGTKHIIKLTDDITTSIIEIQNKLGSEGTVLDKDGKIHIETKDKGNGVNITAQIKDQIGTTISGTSSSPAEANFNISDLRNKTINISVNGEVKTFTFNDTLVDDDIYKILENELKDVVNISRDPDNPDKITLTSPKTVDGEKIEVFQGGNVGISKPGETIYNVVNGADGNQLKSTGKDIKGIIIDTYGNEGRFGFGEPASGDSWKNISNQVKGNTFIIDDVKFTVTDVTSEPATLTGKTDTTELMKTLKTFVEEYNTIIAKVDKMVSEKKQYSYMPLTDEQKKEMSEDEIKLWNEKCKQGLLKRDDILSGLQRDLREAFMTPVVGSSLSLNSIGISFNSDYTKAGQLVINEEKLSKALEENSDDVLKMFTGIPDSSVAKSDKYKNTGIMQRIKTIINDTAVSSTSDLVKKAGYEGKKEYDNALYESIKKKEIQIADFEKLVKTKENMYYLQFANLEKTMNQLNSQQSWLMQQFGG